ncbi:uncharacterized protein LOC122922900 isoform X3 [Bufo gargarizans]|uniref:uncharacterized protein LOC122922900 isoform X3 n=1 Tax=Bufo gargarizans TaxID=30331 RepID=UPI001CF15D61|nr:uncharacterized protein LOC122922900 isoform X3 [Bufo gargarizans]
MAHKLVLILGALKGVLSQETQKRELHTNPGSHVNLPYARTLLNGTKIQVYQTPEVHATPGSDVTLPCTYNVSGVEEATIGSFTWYRHLVKTGPEVSDSSKDFTGRISRADTEQFISNRDAHITIHNVLDSDAGSYFCAVSFLEGETISGSGAGTLLNVTDVRDPMSSSPLLHICLGVGFGVALVVALLTVTGYRISRQALRSTAEVGPIIYTEFIALGNRSSSSLLLQWKALGAPGHSSCYYEPLSVTESRMSPVAPNCCSRMRLHST